VLWQLIGAGNGDSITGKIGHLHHTVAEDPSLIDTASRVLMCEGLDHGKLVVVAATRRFP
jgi:hypothetical protein